MLRLQLNARKLMNRPGWLAILCGFVVVFGLQLHLLRHYNINWDEFYFLSLIHEFERGTLTRTLQTFHVRLFAWLPALPGNEVDQILAGRLVMLGAQWLTVLLIIQTARRFVPDMSAAFAALVWLSAGFTLSQGFSFRADPAAALILMSAIALCLSPQLRIWQMILGGVLIGLAGMVTIKSALYMPAFLGVLVFQRISLRQEWRVLARGVVIVTGSAVVAFILLYGWHQSMTAASTQAGAGMANGALRTTILESEWFPQWESLRLWLLFSAAVIVLALLGAPRSIAALLFATPFLAVVFYRNSFPYFFPFITAPLMVAVALGVERIRSRPVLVMAVALSMIGSVVAQAVRVWPDDQRVQRAVVGAVHDIFPEPAPYIDRNSMIASFPKHGFFMSGWGYMGYVQSGRPVMEGILAEHAPPLLIANSPILEQAMDRETDHGRSQYLFEEDVQALRAAYQPYWGPLYVAGMEVSLAPEGVTARVLIEGKYRLDADHAVRVDGVALDPGGVLTLSRGKIRVTAAEPGVARLIWAGAGSPPVDSVPEGEIYAGF